MSCSISSRPKGAVKGGHGAYRSQMPESPIRVHELESCDSTQDELRALAAAGAPAFTAVRADVQRAGRGTARTALGGARGHRAARLDPAAARPPRARAPRPQPGRRHRGRRVRARVRRRRPPELAERRRLRAAASSAACWPSSARTRASCSASGMNLAVAGRRSARPATACPDVAAARDRALPRRAPAALRALLGALRPLAALFDDEGPAAIAAAPGRSTRSPARRCELRLASGDVVEGTAAGIADDGSLLVRAAGGVRAYAERRGRAPDLRRVLTRYARGRDPAGRVRHRHRRRRRQDLRVRAARGARARRRASRPRCSPQSRSATTTSRAG